jgi:hypothetical protein
MASAGGIASCLLARDGLELEGLLMEGKKAGPSPFTHSYEGFARPGVVGRGGGGGIRGFRGGGRRWEPVPAHDDPHKGKGNTVPIQHSKATPSLLTPLSLTSEA